MSDYDWSKHAWSAVDVLLRAVLLGVTGWNIYCCYFFASFSPSGVALCAMGAVSGLYAASTSLIPPWVRR